MKKKFAPVILLLVASTLAFSACATQQVDDAVGSEVEQVVEEVAEEIVEDETGKQVVAFINPAHDNPFFKTEADTAKAKLTELGYETLLMVHGDDPNKQSELIDQAISSGVVAIILDNAGAEASVAAIQKAKDAGVPVFLIDREINQTGIAEIQVVANNYQGGQMAAEEFARLLDYEGKYVEFLGWEADNCAIIRTQAFHDVLDQFEDMEMVAQQSANWDQTEAFTLMETIIQANPDLDGVIAGNDTMAVGAQAALEAAGMTDVIIVGFDGSPDAAELIKKGKMHATVLEPMVDYTILGVEAMDNYLKTGSTGMAEKQLVDCTLVLPEDVDRLVDFMLLPE